MADVDFTKPIEVVDFTGKVYPARYERNQTMKDDYEIFFEGEKYTVRSDHVLKGRTAREGWIDPGFTVRNCASETPA